MKRGFAGSTCGFWCRHWKLSAAPPWDHGHFHQFVKGAPGEVLAYCGSLAQEKSRHLLTCIILYLHDHTKCHNVQL